MFRFLNQVPVETHSKTREKDGWLTKALTGRLPLDAPKQYPALPVGF